jgi:hypothetical protein
MITTRHFTYRRGSWHLTPRSHAAFGAIGAAQFITFKPDSLFQAIKLLKGEVIARLYVLVTLPHNGPCTKSVVG